jgi:rhomboid protease GluP
MNLNLILIQLVALSCFLLLWRSAHLPRGWVLVAIGTLSVLAGTYLWLPAQAGWISGGFWFWLILVPSLGFNQVNRLLAQERYTLARRWAMGLRWLHPLDGLMTYPHLLRGLELAHQGDLATAQQIFARYHNDATAIGRTAQALLYRSTAQWEDLLAWADHLPAQARWREPTLGLLYVRSLGETGQLNELLQAVTQFAPPLEHRGDSVTLNLIRLFALAFCGQVAPVQQILTGGTLANYAPQIQQFWQATAELAAGQDETARAQFLALRDRSPVPQQRAIDQRLAQPYCNVDQVLTGASQKILIRLRQDSQQDAQYNLRSHINQPKVATKVLIGLNLIMFGLEIWAGGSESISTLYRLGAMVPNAVWAGEWWRLLNGTFLHLGWVHLLLNMFSLYFFGAFVEPVLGVRKFIAAYLFSGVGSMLVVALLARGAADRAEIYVGASGAIMGLLGLMAVILWQGWSRDRAKVAGRQLRFVLLIMALQTATDLMNPQISVVGHVSGFMLGALIGSWLYQPGQRK